MKASIHDNTMARGVWDAEKGAGAAGNSRYPGTGERAGSTGPRRCA